LLAIGGEQPDDAGIDYAGFLGPQSSKWPSPRAYAKFNTQSGWYRHKVSGEATAENFVVLLLANLFFSARNLNGN
jgi:hypothetical protein